MKHQKTNNFSNIPRHFFVLGTFFVAFTIIIFKVFTYTITDHDFYKEKADFQQIGERKISITRGKIISKNKSNALFATSVHLNDLAIDPTRKWDKIKLAVFLKEIVFRESCKDTTREECKNNILKFLKKEEIENFQYNKEFINNLIYQKLIIDINKKYRTSILIAQELDEKTIIEIKKLNLKWVYTKNWNLYINPEEILDKKLFSKLMSPVISYPVETLERLSKRKKIQYLSILKRISIDASDIIEKRIDAEYEAINKWFLNKKDSILKFLILTPNPHRLYPENKIASQVLGFVDSTGQGHYWLEWYFNDILKWKTKEKVSRVDIKWRIINPINLKTENINRNWVTIYSTIDRNIQKNVEDILEKWVKKYNANKWSVIVMDPQNGKIMAMANYPKFDPNKPWEVYELTKLDYEKYRQPKYDLIWKWVFVEDKIKWKKNYINWKEILLRKAERHELWNYMLKKYIYKNDFWAQVYRNSIISDLYEPWSIMKSMTMAIWIDSWEITQNTFYQNNWPIKIDHFPISDVSKACLGYHSFTHALNYSCNVWMVRIAQKIWKALMYNYMNDFWFGKLTDIELDWEVNLPIKNYEKWSRAQLFTTSYWLWINVNQLQMAIAYSSLVNWWLILKPQIVDKIDFGDWNISKYKKEIIRRVISEKTSNIMRKVLVSSIDNGVAKNWKVEWYSIWWKTWTSDIAYKWGYEKWVGSTNASFAWFWPAQDPKFVIIVKLRRPRTSIYWGLTSSYIFSDVAKYLLNYYRIPKIWEK